jgi:hypothetical protein
MQSNIARVRVAAGVAIAMLALGSCYYHPWQDLPPISAGPVEGIVIGSTPVRGAVVEIRALDSNGAPRGQRYEATTDDQGRYRIEVRGLRPPFQVTARGGVTGEYWTAEPLTLDTERVHLRAVVDSAWLWKQGSTVYVTVSPLTTLAAALAEQRRAEKQERSLDAATARAHELLGGHLDVDLRQTLPAAAVDASLTAEVRYTLALAGFSAIAHEAAIATGRSIASMNVFLLTAALVEDARGPDALLDGVGPAGPVSLGSCGAACPLPADALRSALVTALVRDYLPSAANAAGLAFGDIAEYLLHLTGNTEPGLFDALPTQDLDKQPPVLALLPSPVFDELRDRIAFDATGQPDHVHDALAAIDLRAGLGDTCPVVYKHADLLRPVAPKTDTNPLRWRMSALDDLVGVRAMDVTATVQPPGNGAASTVPASATTTAAGEPVFEILLNAATVPALAEAEGIYQFQLGARDGLGNEAAPLAACWQHVVLAPPLRAGSLVALGPDSLDVFRFESDNLAPVLRGELAPGVARLLVENNTDAGAYLTLNLDDLAGRYTASAIDSRALLRQDADRDDCLGQQTCSAQAPPETTSQTIGPAAVPRSFVRLRVVEQGSGRDASCAECDPGEFYLAPHGSYEVQAVVADLSFLIPPGVPRDQIAEILVGPIGSAVRLTGADDGVYVHCFDPFDAVTCDQHAVFQLYRALTSAIIEVDRLVISAQTSAFPKSTPRTPMPSVDGAESTLAEPVSAGFTWTTQDATLPDPG